MGRFFRGMFLLLIVPVVGFVCIASAMFNSINGRGFDVWAWPHAWKWFGTNWWVTACIVASSLIAIGLLIPYVMCVVRFARGRSLRRLTSNKAREIERAKSDNLGHERFAELADLGDRFDGPGNLIGAWGRGKRDKMLFDNPEIGPGHSMVFAGPGSDKTRTLVTRIWLTRGPRVVFDPSEELEPILTPALLAQGYTVHTIGLRPDQGGINILDWIDIEDPEADTHIRTVVAWIHNGNATPETQRDNPYWDDRGKALITCLLAHLMYSNAREKSLRILRRGIAMPEDRIMPLLRDIHLISNSQVARDLAAGLMGMRAVETFSGIYSNADSATAWLGVPAYAKAVSDPTMKTSDILNRNSVTFVNIPLRTMQPKNTPQVGRSIMAALFNALFQRDGFVTDPVSFFCDEAWTLGASDEILLCHTTARKYKVRVQTIWPSVAQCEKVWAALGVRMLRETSSWVSYNAILDGPAAEALSQDLGEYGVIAYSEGDTEGMQKPRASLFAWGSKSEGQSQNKSEIVRRLRKRSEIMRARADEMFVFVRDFGYPLHINTAPYSRYPWISRLMGQNRFSLGFNTATTSNGGLTTWFGPIMRAATRLKNSNLISGSKRLLLRSDNAP